MSNKVIRENPLQIALKCSFQNVTSSQGGMQIPTEVLPGLADHVLYLNCSSLNRSQIPSIRKFLETPEAKSDVRTLIFCTQPPSPKIKTSDTYTSPKLIVKKEKAMTKNERLEMLMKSKKCRATEAINSPMALMNELLGLVVEFISTSSSLHSVIFESLYLLEGISKVNADVAIQPHLEAAHSATRRDKEPIVPSPTMSSTATVPTVTPKSGHFMKNQIHPIDAAEAVHSDTVLVQSADKLKSITTAAPVISPITPIQRVAVTAPLDMNSAITTLILLDRFGDALLESKSVKWLCFRHCPVGDQTFRRLVPSLVKLPLQVLMFESCQLTDGACKYIASIIKANESRMEVELWNHTLRASSQELSGKYVWNDKNRIHSSGLMAVSLRGNHITGKGLEVLTPCLTDNHWLLGLKLSNNQIDERSINTFIANMSVSCGLQAVLFNGNIGYSRGVCQDIIGKLEEINNHKDNQFRNTSVSHSNVRNFNSVSGSGSKDLIFIQDERTRGSEMKSPDTIRRVSVGKPYSVPNSALLEKGGGDANQRRRGSGGGADIATACLNSALPEGVSLLLQRWKQKLQVNELCKCVASTRDNMHVRSPIVSTEKFNFDSRSSDTRRYTVTSDTSATGASQQMNDNDTNIAVIAPNATAASATPPVKVIIAPVVATKHMSPLPPPAPADVNPSSSSVASSSSTISSRSADDEGEPSAITAFTSKQLAQDVPRKQMYHHPSAVPIVNRDRPRLTTTPVSGTRGGYARMSVTDSQHKSLSGQRNPNMLLRSATTPSPSSATRPHRSGSSSESRVRFPSPTVSSFHEVIPSRRRIEVKKSVCREPGHVRSYLPPALDTLNTNPGMGIQASKTMVMIPSSFSSAPQANRKKMKVTKKSQKTKRTKKQSAAAAAAAHNKRNTKKKSSNVVYAADIPVYSNNYGATYESPSHPLNPPKSPLMTTDQLSRHSPSGTTSSRTPLVSSATSRELLMTPADMVKLTESLEATSLRLRNICLTVSDTIKLNSHLQKDILLQQQQQLLLQQSAISKGNTSTNSSRALHQTPFVYSSITSNLSGGSSGPHGLSPALSAVRHTHNGLTSDRSTHKSPNYSTSNYDFSNMMNDSYGGGYDDINSSLQRLAEIYSHLSPLKDSNQATASFTAQNLAFLNQVEVNEREDAEKGVVRATGRNHVYRKTSEESPLMMYQPSRLSSAATTPIATTTAVAHSSSSISKMNGQPVAFSAEKQPVPVSSRYDSLRQLNEEEEDDHKEEGRNRQYQAGGHWVALNSEVDPQDLTSPTHTQQMRQSLEIDEERPSGHLSRTLNMASSSQTQQHSIQRQDQENEELMKLALTNALRKKISETLNNIDSSLIVFDK